ncbi:hypothetical protein DSM106972_047230 [Dulcicalothrix desertica PCC 7102]|uniref:Uncharacterized protein n=1 Tax=Dulcicalothrix desertica PCC 7102 TaxID=232991 RepID=A0A3S1B2X6_9CYAN|nr:hypothetical protein [Dulcicalothrix desertica]RUT03809.1 hypothetical protein DSM106972_047230 [Dulcicalothrix desertica PCC 7102]TWH43782.1 hypothetical protein CAL7102_07526 [Dulcicalothrix desertica PCC 7102]
MPVKPKQYIVRFEMLLTKEILEHWQALADKVGISKAELVRRSMAGCRIKTIPEANWQCCWELLKISTSISQIAQAQESAINQGLTPPPINPIPFQELATEISRLRAQLILGTDGANNEAENTDDWEN